MSEQKNALSLKVDVDTKEANESIRGLTAAANECVEALERLEKKLEKFNSPFAQINVKGLVNPDAIKIVERTLGIRDF